MWIRRCKEKGIPYIHITMHSKTVLLHEKCNFMDVAKITDLLIVFSCSQVGAVEFCQLSLDFL